MRFSDIVKWLHSRPLVIAGSVLIALLVATALPREVWLGLLVLGGAAAATAAWFWYMLSSDIIERVVDSWWTRRPVVPPLSREQVLERVHGLLRRRDLDWTRRSDVLAWKSGEHSCVLVRRGAYESWCVVFERVVADHDIGWWTYRVDMLTVPHTKRQSAHLRSSMASVRVAYAQTHTPLVTSTVMYEAVDELLRQVEEVVFGERRDAVTCDAAIEFVDQVERLADAHEG